MPLTLSTVLVNGCLERVSTLDPRINLIPGPEKLLPYRNFLINVGVNDLDRSAPLPPNVLVQQLEEKCYAIHNMYPKANILLAPVLPTRDRFLNNRVRKFNDYLKCLAGIMMK